MNKLLLFIDSIMMTSCGVKKSIVLPETATTFTLQLHEIITTEIAYRQSLCNPKQVLKVEDFDCDYVLLKKL